ncbi:lipid II:glycine glycyltransferase FemX [Serinicoccus marinus]|uniref:lipid II:glycine glycyltransferase FemX n=1 Tax=Serinicoccus marinus TaxID=247333 RepID=UPI0003B2EC45|nr:peptidoglycan bridge formation glycyltransferase FemA/FemB family protein [Serinicoccus marinus]
MTLTWVEPQSNAAWRERLLATPGQPSMFQTPEFAQVKAMMGWTPRYADIDGFPVTVHERRAPGFGKVWYLPKGPGVATLEQLEPLLPPLREAAHREGVFLVKLEPEIVESPETLAGLDRLGLRASGRIQTNKNTVFVDVTGTPDDLMARFPSKTRNTIRRGIKQGVVAEAAPLAESTYERMWTLWMEVVQDQGITPRGHDYQVAMWRTFCDAGLGRVFLAQHEGRDVAGAFVTVVGHVACYRDGASVRERPVRGGSHALQWAAMQWAQSQGATTYDMAGTPHSTKVDDRDDPYFGIGEFKRSFAKEVTDFVGTYDLVVRPRRYALWQRIGHRVTAKVVSRGRSGATFY